MSNINKIRPEATVKFNYGTDGRDFCYYISFRCPKCNKFIREKDIACTECGTFFDWSKQARIEVVRTVVWE